MCNTHKPLHRLALLYTKFCALYAAGMKHCSSTRHRHTVRWRSVLSENADPMLRCMEPACDDAVMWWMASCHYSVLKLVFKYDVRDTCYNGAGEQRCKLSTTIKWCKWACRDACWHTRTSGTLQNSEKASLNLSRSLNFLPYMLSENVVAWIREKKLFKKFRNHLNKPCLRVKIRAEFSLKQNDSWHFSPPQPNIRISKRLLVPWWLGLES